MGFYSVSLSSSITKRLIHGFTVPLKPEVYFKGNCTCLSVLHHKPDRSCAHVKADVKNTLTGIGYLDAHPRPKSKVTQAPVAAVMCLASRVSTGSIKASAHTKGSTRDPVSGYDLPVTAVDFICSTWAELINRPLMKGIPFVQSWFVLHQPHQPPP